MRLVTRKVWRAFPQLDRFSDQECLEFVNRVRRSLRYQAAVFSLCLFLFIALFFVMAMINALAIQVLNRRGLADLGLIFPVIGVVLQIAVPSLVMLLGRDAVLDFSLKRIVGAAVCPTCGYSLLGQRTLGCAIRCPECGQFTSLRELGLSSPEDLLPPDHPASPAYPAHPENPQAPAAL
jgi:hypothetical protein